MLLRNIDNLIQETVFEKLKKYSGDIGAGAVGHLAGVANSHYTHSDPVAHAGVVGAYKAYDVGSQNYQNKQKSIGGSVVGVATGNVLSRLAIHGAQKFHDYSQHHR